MADVEPPNPYRPIVRNLSIDITATVFGAAGIGAILWAQFWLGLLLLLVLAVGISLRFWLAWPRTGGSGARLLPLAAVPRTFLACGVAVALTPATPADGSTAGWVTGIAAGLLVAVIVSGPLLRRAANVRVPFVAHLPGLPDDRPRRDYATPTNIASLAATGFGLLLAAAGGRSPWLWTIAAALALVPAALLALDGRRKILASRQMRETVPTAVTDYAPEFVVYTSRPDDASYQITMWLPYLMRTGRRFVIITRSRVPAEVLAGLTSVPVIEGRRLSDLDALVAPSMRAAFYVNASSGNGGFVRYSQLTHVYLGHGDSDKPPSYNPTHAMYDQVFAAGPAATRRYAAHGVRIPAEKFQVVGRPQAEDVKLTDRPIGEVAEPVVLYAPTWKGHVEETMLYSLPVGEQIVAALLRRGAAVLFRPHPFSYYDAADSAAIDRIHALLAADAAVTGRQHRWGAAAETELGILDCMNVSDAMITDVSSVVSDYLYSGKPFAMIAVPSEPDCFRDEYPVSRASYVVRGDLADLEPVLDQMLGPDAMAGERAAIRSDYLGDFPAENYANVFITAVNDVVTQSHAAVESDDETGESIGEDAEAASQEAAEEAATELRARISGYRQILEASVLNLSGTALGCFAFLSALLRAPAGGTLSLALLGFAAAGYATAIELRGQSGWHRLLSRFAVTRAVLISVLMVLGATQGAQLPVLLPTAALLAMSLMGESYVVRGWGRLGLELRDFPAAAAGGSERLPRGLVMAAGSVALILSLIVVAVRLPTWIALVLALLAAAIFVDAIIRALSRARNVVAAVERFPAALRAYAPEFVVYFSSTVGAAYQVGMWLPYFERIGRKYVIVTRTVAMLEEIAELTAAAGVRVPIIFRPTLRSVEEMVVPSLTTAFYVNNAARNSHLVERRELTHVWLNHGDSEKPACFNPVHAIYDLLFAAGQAGIDRYARHGVNIPAEKFRIVGRPQVEAIAPAAGPVARIAKPTVLYAPTWQGPFADSRVFSLPIGRRIVEELLVREARVIFRAHPFNYRYRECAAMITEIGKLLAADKAKTGRDHLWGPAAEQEMTIEDCFNASDAMIADVSAVVSDYLRSDKPFSIVSVGRTPEELLEVAPAAKAAYVLTEDLSNLREVCDNLLRADPVALSRRSTKVYYLGDFPEPYAQGFLTAARKVVDREAG